MGELATPENARIRSTAIIDDGATILAAPSTGGLQIWDRSTRELIYTIDPDLSIEDIDVSEDGSIIAVCGHDEGNRGILRLYRR